MKTSTMKWMIAVAALTVAAGSASAQTYKAEIPMSFRVGDKLMAPGSYQISMAGGVSRQVICFQNLASWDAGVVVPTVKGDAPTAGRQAGKPRVSFECLGNACRLSGMWNGRDRSAYVFPASKPRARDLEAPETTVVTLAMIKVR